MIGSSRAPDSSWDRIVPWAICALALPIFFHGLGDYSLVNGDEGFYHYVARQMLRSGDWFHLEFTGEHRIYDTFMNAPWAYWAQAILIRVFGDNPWSMRLLSASAGVLTVLMTYRLTAWLADRTAGLLAALVQLTTVQFVYLHSARTGERDTIVALLFVLIAYLFLRALETGKSFISHHVCLALLLGIKLPVILMPLAAEVAFFALFSRARERWRDWALCCAWVLPLGLTWHVGQALAHWDACLVVLQTMGTEAVASGADSLLWRPLANGRFYADSLIFGAFPWVAAYPFAIGSVLRGETPAARERWALLALVAGAVLGFFLLVGKTQPWYVLPAYPFLSAFTGYWLARMLREPPRLAPMLACSIVLSLIAWTRLEITDFNPYAFNARRIAMMYSVRGGNDLVFAVGAAATAAAFLLGFIAVRKIGKARPGAGAAIFLAVLLTVAAWRTLRPMAFTNYESEMERTHEALRDAREPIRFPVPIRERSPYKVRFYFADDYRIERVTDRANVAYLLWAKVEGEGAGEPDGG